MAVKDPLGEASDDAVFAEFSRRKYGLHNAPLQEIQRELERRGEARAVGVHAIAEMMGVTRGTIHKWIDAGLPTERDTRGRHTLSRTVGAAWLRSRSK